MDEPIKAVRSAPGEYFLAAEKVHVGLRFQVHDAVYEIVSEPARWGAAWTATAKIIEGLKPGGKSRAMIHTGRRMNCPLATAAIAGRPNQRRL